MFNTIVAKTKRVPTLHLPLAEENVTPSEYGVAMTRQLDVALLSVGWKLSAPLFNYLSGHSASFVQDYSNKLLSIMNELVGNHVQHNVYFKNFPKNVPDAEGFWHSELMHHLKNTDEYRNRPDQTSNLFGPYGRYLHSYGAMVLYQEELLPSLKDKVKILHLGKSLEEETLSLYHQLTASSVPLNEVDRKLVQELAELCLDKTQPERFPVRENKALVNQVRLEKNRTILVDTVTDVLRLACALSGGDVTLVEKTKFKSFPRKQRRILLSALDGILMESAKILDVNRYPERWKRLGEKLHPHEAKQMSVVQDLFAVARGDKNVQSPAAKVEIAILQGNLKQAIKLLENTPGALFRSLDRMIILCENDWLLLQDLLEVVRSNAGKVSGRVLLSVWEHLLNRTERAQQRMFTNTKGKTWVQAETRFKLSPDVTDDLILVLKEELSSRLLKMGIEYLEIEQDALGLALPLSEKNKSTGFGVMPKGSVIPVHGENLRFFIYWKQKSQRTDFDLAAFFMNEGFQNEGHCSWTNLGHGQYSSFNHSGDIVEAHNGASEFIDMNLSKVKSAFIVAQINRFAGENFAEVEESFFGFMERGESQKGLPFEAKTVKVKADVRGQGQVAIPAVFMKNSDGSWVCKWLDFQLPGQPSLNTVEGSKLTTAMLIKAAVNRRFLTVKDLRDILPGTANPEKKAFVGFQKPENLSDTSKVFTLDNLTGLIPE